MQQLSSAQFMGIHISQSPRRLRAKYTQYTNFVYALGFRPCRGQSHVSVTLFRRQADVFVNGQPMLSTHFYGTAFPPFLTRIARREEEAQQRIEIHLYGCASCTMSGAGSPIYPATPSKRICMQTIRKKRLSWKKPMKQGLRVIQCMSEYRIIKERNLYDSQNRLHKERTEGRDDRPLTYTHINSLSLIC